MAITKVNIIGGGGGGGRQTRGQGNDWTLGEDETEQVFVNPDFTIDVDGNELSPAVVTDMEIENDGDEDVTRDQCGRMERTRTGTKGWTMTVSGIVTVENRNGNLSFERLKQVAQQDTVFVVSEMLTGDIVIRNTLIRNGDFTSISTTDTEGDERAFEFQLQLGEAESE